MKYEITNFITVNGRRKAIVTVSNGEACRELFVEVPAEMQEIAGTYEGDFRVWKREKDGRVYNNVAFHGEQVLVEAAKAASVEDIFAAFSPAAAPATTSDSLDFSSNKSKKAGRGTPDL